jgi:hypothetical protein
VVSGQHFGLRIWPTGPMVEKSTFSKESTSRASINSRLTQAATVRYQVKCKLDLCLCQIALSHSPVLVVVDGLLVQIHTETV